MGDEDVKVLAEQLLAEEDIGVLDRGTVDKVKASHSGHLKEKMKEIVQEKYEQTKEEVCNMTLDMYKERYMNIRNQTLENMPCLNRNSCYGVAFNVTGSLLKKDNIITFSTSKSAQNIEFIGLLENETIDADKMNTIQFKVEKKKDRTGLGNRQFLAIKIFNSTTKKFALFESHELVERETATATDSVVPGRNDPLVTDDKGDVYRYIVPGVGIVDANDKVQIDVSSEIDNINIINYNVFMLFIEK
nr:MAG: hypothetical protein [Hemigrapsus takanoi nimavirus]